MKQIRKQIEELKQHICADANNCTCQYVEINEGEPVPIDALEIIEANQRCRQHDRAHVGFTAIVIGKVD
jgi:hypothetical protein